MEHTGRLQENTFLNIRAPPVFKGDLLYWFHKIKYFPQTKGEKANVQVTNEHGAATHNGSIVWNNMWSSLPLVQMCTSGLDRTGTFPQRANPLGEIAII